MGYVTIIRADPRGWALAYRNANTIVHHRLHAPSNDPEAARREARMLVSPDVAVIIPRLGERVLSQHRGPDCSRRRQRARGQEKIRALVV